VFVILASLDFKVRTYSHSKSGLMKSRASGM
jgi:hypothetical protein